MHFSRELLKSNDMIPREIWCTSVLVNFLMTTKSHSPYGLKQFFRPWIIYFKDKLQSKSCCHTNKLLWWLTVRAFSTCSWLLWSQAIKWRIMYLVSQSFIFLELQVAIEYCQGGKLSWTGRVPKVISERDLELFISRQECISEVTHLF